MYTHSVAASPHHKKPPFTLNGDRHGKPQFDTKQSSTNRGEFSPNGKIILQFLRQWLGETSLKKDQEGCKRQNTRESSGKQSLLEMAARPEQWEYQ